MQPIVAVIAPGMMGSGVGGRLAQNGIEVRTALGGRSEGSVKRAQAAGMVGVSDAQIAASDFILSIVPPGEALGLAERLAPALRAAAKKPIYIDCNAVNPATVLRIARTIEETGAIFVDGGIIGGPPAPGSKGTKLYLSGPAASRVMELATYGLEPRVQAGTDRRGLGDEDVLCRHHQGFHRAGRGDDAGRGARRHHRRAARRDSPSVSRRCMGG